MSFVSRGYEDIVRDLLTTLTGGTVRESLPAPVGDSLIAPQKLKDRPVRRISHIEGKTILRQGAEPTSYRFTAADFELVSSTGDEQNKDSIRFRKEGRKPAPGTSLIINYYPVQTNPLPLTDLNVGSVIRTILEATAREDALVYLNLQNVYDSAFLDTATGGSLDKVVALVGVTRLPTGFPIAKLRFSRRDGVVGQITIPTGTPVTDADANRYLTLESITLEPYETTRDVNAGGESAGTKAVEANKLTRMEVLIAGVSEVTNPDPARLLSSPESDDELRRRARGALHGTVRGTNDALRFALLSLSGVKDVAITEFPNGVPGEIKVDVAYNTADEETKKLVALRIEEFRPAGVRVITGEAARKQISVKVELTLAGGGVSGAELDSLKKGLEDRIAAYLTGIPPGGQVRKSQLSALALQDSRIVDAAIHLIPTGSAAVDELTLDAATVIDVQRPFLFADTKTEKTGAAAATVSTVSAHLPVHLVAGITEANAKDAINKAIDAHLASRKPDEALTFDSLAAAIRDDSRFALIRSDSTITVQTADGRFRQLTDGIGSYAPAPNESLSRDVMTIEPREGAI